jgi:hypothetical protein
VSDSLQLGFEFASELSKQIITLATGILALTITFHKDVLEGRPRRGDRLLATAWIALLLAVSFGIWHLMALTGHLVSPAGASGIGPSARLPAALQVIAFAAGLGLVIAYGALNLFGSRARERPSKSTK